MVKIKIIHQKKECISCGACAAISPEYWEMDEEGLSHLKGSKIVDDHEELVINSHEAAAENQEAADVCPVQIIKLEKLED